MVDMVNNCIVLVSFARNTQPASLLKRAMRCFRSHSNFMIYLDPKKIISFITNITNALHLHICIVNIRI